MPKLKVPLPCPLLIPILLLLTLGCDDRATKLTREAADRQAQQNTAMAELNKEVAAGTHKLVDADSQARKDLLGVHHDLQAERTRLDTNWSALETERQRVAEQRRTESALAALSGLSGSVLLTALLLGFCWFLLVGAHRQNSSAELAQLVVDHNLAEELLVAGPSKPRLNAPPSGQQPAA